MGIIIKGAGPGAVEVALECDETAAFFCRGFAVFTSPEGFVGCHSDAMKAGWLERNGPKGRMWICPACSGK